MLTRYSDSRFNQFLKTPFKQLYLSFVVHMWMTSTDVLAFTRLPLFSFGRFVYVLPGASQFSNAGQTSCRKCSSSAPCKMPWTRSRPTDQFLALTSTIQTSFHSCQIIKTFTESTSFIFGYKIIRILGWISPSLLNPPPLVSD